MNKEVKYNSVQGGPFNTSQNRVNFQLPNFGVYDMSKSYINLNVQMEVVESTGAGGVGVYNVDLAWNNTAKDNTPYYPNVSLCKNAWLKTGKQGMVENIRRVDVLKSLMTTYKSTVEEQTSKSYYAGNQISNPRYSARNSIYVDLNKEGVHKSRYNQIAPVKIPLGDLFDFCFQADELDLSKCNGANIELELNINKVKGVFIDNIDNLVAGAEKLFNCVNLDTEGEQLTLNPIALTNSIDESPYYVGQKILVNATGNGGAGNLTNQPAVIASITRNPTTGALTLGLEQTIGNLNAGESWSDVVLSSSVPTSVTPKFNFAEVVLVELPMSSSSVDAIEFSTFTTEETNGNGLTNYQNQFLIEPESDAVILAFPDVETDLVSQHTITDYRLRLDNEDLTDRNVELNSPLYYDRLTRAFLQMKMNLKNLIPFVPDSSVVYNGTYQETDFEFGAILAPVPQKLQSNDKQFQVNITSGGVNKMILYKHMPRKFNY